MNSIVLLCWNRSCSLSLLRLRRDTMSKASVRNTKDRERGCDTLAGLSLPPSVGCVLGCYGKTFACCNYFDTCHNACDDAKLPPVHFSSCDQPAPSSPHTAHLVWHYSDAQLIIWETADNVTICLSAWFDVRFLSPSCGTLGPCVECP